MAVQTFDNYFLSNEIEDEFTSHLDLQNFCTIDSNLQGTAGMIRKINVYGATGNAEKVAYTEGNTTTIGTTLTTKDYKIQLAQARFKYYDEDMMTDPTAVQTGITHLGTSLFNVVNEDIFSEFGKATLEQSATTLNFNAFVDAMTQITVKDVNANADTYQNTNYSPMFCIAHKKDLAKLRKNLGDNLQYVEAHAKKGYIGTCAGVDIYISDLATENTLFIATKSAITVFNKTGVETETASRGEDEANVRSNTMFARKYYIVALTDETQVVKLTVASA